MPCGSAEDYQDELYADLQEVTQLLCVMCKAFDGKLPTAVIPWWTKHKKIDAERERRERAESVREDARRSALKKLSTEEREALGL